MSTQNNIETSRSILRDMDQDNRLANLAHRAITFTDRITAGGKDNYGKIIDGQPVDDQLSLESYSRLNDCYYTFKVCPDLRYVLELYIALEAYSYTSAARKVLFHLPKVSDTGSDHANALLSLINGNFLDEIQHMDLAQYSILKEVVRYGAYLEQIQRSASSVAPQPFSENAQRILLAACISLFAATGDCGVFDGNPHLTESATSSLRTYIMKRHNPVMAAQIYNLIKND